MKHGSRLRSITAFTFAMIAGVIAPDLAHADRVVLYPVTGRADSERLDEIEERIAQTIRDLGHDVLAPPGGIGAERPETSAALGGVATASGATYVVLADIEPLRGQYRLHVRVGYQPTQRAEDLVVTVMDAEEAARLRDVLSALLRPDGLGEDAVRLTGEADPAADEAERLRREEEERARQAALDEEARLAEEERARREAEAADREADEAARRAQERADQQREAWNSRATYGSDGEWLLMLGAGGSYAIGFTDRPVFRDGMLAPGERTNDIGGLGSIQARVGRAFSGTDGLELRGGVDVVLGAAAGLAIVVGGAWQWTPLVDVPIHVGVALELGGNFTFTGARDAGFLVRGGLVASWTPMPQLQIEVALPELGVFTNGPGAFVIGGSLRAGYRFF